MVLKLTRKTKGGKTYGLVTGIPKNMLLNDLAKKYSRKWSITGFGELKLGEGKLLLIERSVTRKTPYNNFNEWSRKG